MRRTLATLALAICGITAAAQNLTVTPTTTYASETGNNTSAAATFATQVNGNIGGANISKLDTHTLLYPGFSGKIYAHVEPWWGSTSHINIGYSSQDSAQVQRQISDMKSRGIDGAVVDWYGPGSYEDGTVKTFFSQAELNSGFSAIVEIDVGAVNWHSCYPTCNATTAVVNLFTTMGNNFFSSPAYARSSTGRPVAMEFGMETLSLPSGMPTGWNVVDWTAVQTQVPGNMALFHRNLGGFSKAQSAGAFGWMDPKTLDVEPANYDGTDELVWFYGQSFTTNAARSFGAAWKGFNDILAAWAPAGGRHIEQNCGQTWLNTFAVLNQYYSSSNQIAALQLVTWNDYEEGSEVESGIDNCVTISASVSGSTLNWAIGGSENTIDHYTVFISTDGVNLMPLGDFAAGTRTVNLANYSPAAGTYTMYVKAIGKPSLTNKMSNAATLTVTGSTSSLSVTPTSGNAPLAVTATVTNGSSSTTINFGDGTTASGTSASHTYSAPGSYTVSASGTTSTVSVAAKALPPVASLALSATTATAPATITASTSGSTDPNQGGSISGSVIDWGDGSTSAGPNASHTYSTAGTYTVTATVTNNYGKSASASQPVNVQAMTVIAPTAVMSVSMNGPTATVTTAGSTAGSGMITSTVIQWGDGTSTAGTIASHTYAKGGYDTITVTVTNSYGKTASTSQQVTAAGVVIWLPRPGTTANQPVHIAATAYDSKPIASMIVYLDGNQVYLGYVSDFDVWISMRSGQHTIVVKAWEDGSGVVYQSSVKFKAQ